MSRTTWAHPYFLNKTEARSLHKFYASPVFPRRNIDKHVSKETSWPHSRLKWSNFLGAHCACVCRKSHLFSHLAWTFYFFTSLVRAWSSTGIFSQKSCWEAAFVLASRWEDFYLRFWLYMLHMTVVIYTTNFSKNDSCDSSKMLIA